MSAWISSTNSSTSGCSFSSSITFFNRSSNSPRYLVPASSAAISSSIIRESRKYAALLPATISCAKPSTKAVLPTPGSPIISGLFLVRRPKIVITRAISLLRPMTGSSFSWRASSVISRPTLSSRGVPLAGCCAFCGSSCSSCKISRRSNTCSKLCCNSTISTPILRRIITAFVFFCTSKLYTRCSVPR